MACRFSELTFETMFEITTEKFFFFHMGFRVDKSIFKQVNNKVVVPSGRQSSSLVQAQMICCGVVWCFSPQVFSMVCCGVVHF